MQEKTSIGFRLFTRLFGESLIQSAYRGILGRPPDNAGLRAHKLAFRRSNNLTQLLHRLAHSEEFAVTLEFSSALAAHRSAHLSNLKKLTHAVSLNQKILLLGNCQVRGLARLFRALTGDADVTAILMLPSVIERFEARDTELEAVIAESNFIFIHADEVTFQLLQNNFPKHYSKVRIIPKVGFAGFHPDVDYVNDSKGEHIFGPLGDYQSSIAFFGWKNSLSKSQTIQLFCESTYEQLGYFEYWNASKEMLLKDGELAGFPLDTLFETWSKRGCWMYSMNHPKLHTLADIARVVLERERINTLPGVEEFVDDEMSSQCVWPVYPEIGARLGLPGHYFFKRSTPFEFRDMPVPMMTLEQFIDESFEAYSKYDRSELTCHRLTSSRFEKLLASIKGAGVFGTPENTAGENNAVLNSPIITQPATQKTNPYAGLPDYQFWRRAIERLPASAVNPVVHPGFALNREFKVATAGSCFAQHISRTLAKHGFNYYVTEGGNTMPTQEAARRNFGVFSARFGNLYTARQLIQLLERAYGRFSPLDNSWTRGDGKLVDPFRPQVEPDGFESIEALEKSRHDHFTAVRDMFENLDIFVFTLGLTETWRNIVDGAVFPLAPGVVAGEMDRARYEFVNFDVRDVVIDLQNFLDKLAVINPNAKIILTVSPVPLIATYEHQHVLVSTTYSKSVLRAAAGEIAKANAHCDYFPSYEIITGNYSRGQYFETDLRSIRQEGVDHVMRIFLSSYANVNTGRIESGTDQQEIMNEMAHVNAAVCDEEAIETSVLGSR
jgi:GSCFA family/Polysaccharide biosynthesis enzyme WcbI